MPSHRRVAERRIVFNRKSVQIVLTNLLIQVIEMTRRWVKAAILMVWRDHLFWLLRWLAKRKRGCSHVSLLWAVATVWWCASETSLFFSFWHQTNVWATSWGKAWLWFRGIWYQPDAFAPLTLIQVLGLDPVNCHVFQQIAIRQRSCMWALHEDWISRGLWLSND